MEQVCHLRSKLCGISRGLKKCSPDTFYPACGRAGLSIPTPSKKESHPNGWLSYLEQGTGIEPAFTAWEAVVLPIYEPCVFVIIAESFGNFKYFLSQGWYCR